MLYNISFKSLGINLNINSVAFSIGNFDIYWYAICITVGLLLAFWYVLSVRRRFNLTEDNILDSLILGVPLAIVFARLYYVVFDLSSFKSIGDVFDLRQGGIAIYGGIIGAAIAVIILYKVKKVDMPSLFDIGSLGFLLGQGIGRWGNFFNGEVYGVETTLPWAMTIKGTYINAVNVHPLFLYESIWNLLGFLVLHLVSKKDKNRFKGKIALMYVAWYGIGRAVLEGLRYNEYVLKVFDTIYVSQVVGIVSAIIAIILIIILQKRKNNKPIGDYMPIYMEDDDIVLDDITPEELDDALKNNEAVLESVKSKENSIAINEEERQIQDENN